MQIQTLISDETWDRFVSGYGDGGHVLQTSTWGRHQSAFGWNIERVAVSDGTKLVAGAQVLVRRIALGQSRAYLPKGPLLDVMNDPVCKMLMDGLRDLCQRRKAIVLKIEPDHLVPDLCALLISAGFRGDAPTVQPRRTILLDLTGDENTILKRMKSKTRYNIRLGGRKGIEIRQGSTGDMHTFNQLMTTTGERDEFAIHSPTYYTHAHELFAPLDMARLFLAFYEDKPVAGLMVFAFGKRAWYMYGASGNEHREKMPTYALQWEAIRWAKSRGCESYDLWGVPDKDKETLENGFIERRDGLWGVYRFKRGFGGKVVRYAGAFDRVYNAPLYWSYRLALRLKYSRERH